MQSLQMQHQASQQTWVNLPEPPQDLMKLISSAKENEFITKIVLPSSGHNGGNYTEDGKTEILNSQGNQMS